MEKYFGIISAIVYGRTDLLIPVLPIKHPDNGRLIFPLCGQCGFLAKNGTKCTHEGVQRSFQGCWTSPELMFAIKLGYTVVKIKQIWNFKEKYNELFLSYIANWASLKYRASGWPIECQTQDEKWAFLSALKQKYGFDLKPEDIEKNIPLRTLSKHFLNNLWGKLSTRLDRVGRQVEFISTMKELRTLMMDKKRELIALNALTDNFAIVETSTSVEHSSFHNPVVAAFVCSYGRICLLEHLNRIRPERAVYCDTDSIVYLSNVNEQDPFVAVRGNMLGELKNELDNEAGDPMHNDFIKRWVSLGSKNYAYETANGRLVHRAKGLMVHSSVVGNFDFNLIKAILLKDSRTIQDFYDRLPDQQLALRLKREMFEHFPAQCGVLLPQPTMRRNFKKNEDVKNENDRTKFLRFNFTKRKLVDNRLASSSLDEQTMDQKKGEKAIQ